MKKQWFAITITVATTTTALFVLFWWMGDIRSSIATQAFAAPVEAGDSPTVTAVDPIAAPNDVDSDIVIHGTGFTATLSGTQVITAPTAYLGDSKLAEVIWVNTTTLSATVLWGTEPQIYPLTVINPDDISTTLQSAFTVTQGFGVFTTDGPYGGAIDGIEKKPGTPTTVYALAEGVGLFVSENSGGEWELIYSAPNFMTSLTFDAQDADVMYLGSWESSEYARSLDGGQTWQTIPQIGFPENATGRSYLAAHPTDAGTVFMGVGGLTGLPPGEEGVFRSDDYGMTWITKTTGMTDTDVQSLALHLNDPDKMLAGTWEGNVYASVDGGENWLLSTDLNAPVMGVYFNPYQPLEAWASASTAVHGTPYLYTSTNLTDWTPVIIAPGAPGGCRWNLTFLTDTIWASSSVAYTSTNGGASWAEVPGLHRGANVVAVTPENPQEIYVGHGAGVDKSEDGGQTWQQINKGLAGQLPYLLATSPLDPDLVFVKTGQDIYRSFNGGHAWQELNYGGGGPPTGDYLAIDPYTLTRIYLGEKCEGSLCISISADSGETWNLITSTLPLTYAGWESYALAVAPHPQIPGRILVGNSVWHPDTNESRGMVYASDDYGQNWAYMGPTQPISWIVDIAYDAVDPNLVYMATVGSGQWKSTDGGATWSALPFTLVGNIFDEIAPHPTLSGHLILATGPYTDDINGLFSSQDAGETWTLLPRGNTGSPLVYAPTIPPTLYAFGIEVNSPCVLRRSMDNGLTWETVEGAPWPTRLATASDGERVVLYIGSPGGLASQVGAQTAATANTIIGDVTIFGGGVYRLTTRLPTDWLHLPLVLREYAP